MAAAAANCMYERISTYNGWMAAASERVGKHFLAFLPNGRVSNFPNGLNFSRQCITLIAAAVAPGSAGVCRPPPGIRGDRGEPDQHHGEQIAGQLAYGVLSTHFSFCPFFFFRITSASAAASTLSRTSPGMKTGRCSRTRSKSTRPWRTKRFVLWPCYSRRERCNIWGNRNPPYRR